MPMAATEIAIMPTEEPTNTLMTAPTMSTRAPTISHLPMPDRSRLITLARLAITKNTPAVPANAVMMRSVPFLKPSTMPIRRESMRPMKNVKASSTGTPAAEHRGDHAQCEQPVSIAKHLVALFLRDAIARRVAQGGDLVIHLVSLLVGLHNADMTNFRW